MMGGMTNTTDTTNAASSSGAPAGETAPAVPGVGDAFLGLRTAI